MGKDGWGLQDDGERLWTRPALARLLELADDVLHRLLNLLHGAALARAVKVRDSLVDVQAVLWQLVRERHHLTNECPASHAQDRDGEEDHHEDRRHPASPRR